MDTTGIWPTTASMICGPEEDPNHYEPPAARKRCNPFPHLVNPLAGEWTNIAI